MNDLKDCKDGDLFINCATDERFIFKNNEWLSADWEKAVVKEEPKIEVKAEVEPEIVDDHKVKVVKVPEEKAKPKKEATAAKKTTTKKATTVKKTVKKGIK